MFPKLDVVGWYATGEDLEEGDMLINRKVGKPRVYGVGECARVGIGMVGWCATWEDLKEGDTLLNCKVNPFF